MPIPKPNNNESEKEFLDRCMADETMQEYDESQRYAVCETQLEKKENNMEVKKRHIIEIIEDEKTVTIVYEKDTDASSEEVMEEDQTESVELEEEEEIIEENEHMPGHETEEE